jgi:hypothetical protein
MLLIFFNLNIILIQGETYPGIYEGSNRKTNPESDRFFQKQIIKNCRNPLEIIKNTLAFDRVEIFGGKC